MMTKFPNRSKQLRLGIAAGLASMALFGCATALEHTPEQDAPPRPGVRPEIWVCKPDGNGPWRCELRRGQLR
jgi:hypothetical protein